MILLIIFTGFLLLVYAGLLLYYRVSWTQIPLFELPVPPSKPSTFISVIIPARNEEKTLPMLLDSLLSQTYPAHLFEVIVIDDYSTDETVSVVKKYPAYSILSLKDFIPGAPINSYKKKAIETGIANGTGELIITTDADCYAEPAWLETIAVFYELHHPSLIVMPVAINCSSRPIEIFQSLDFMTLQGITGASVYKKIHSMCNGANLAYTRKAFEAVEGFKDIDRIASGDDMLLMHKIALAFPEGISFLKSPGVIVQTQPVHSVSAFLNQRIRWASKADKYDDKRIFWVLVLVYIFNVMMLLLPLVSIFCDSRLPAFNYHWSILEIWLLLLLFKTLVELVFLYPVAVFFQKQNLLWLFPVAQPFHILYTVIAGWLGKFGTYKWKGRQVK